MSNNQNENDLEEGLSASPPSLSTPNATPVTAGFSGTNNTTTDGYGAGSELVEGEGLDFDEGLVASPPATENVAGSSPFTPASTQTEDSSPANATANNDDASDPPAATTAAVAAAATSAQLEIIDDDSDLPLPIGMIEKKLDAAEGKSDQGQATRLRYMTNDLIPPTPSNVAVLEEEDGVAMIEKKKQAVASDDDSIMVPPSEEMEGDRGTTVRRVWNVGANRNNRLHHGPVDEEEEENNMDSTVPSNYTGTRSSIVTEAYLVEDLDEEVIIATRLEPPLPWWKHLRAKLLFGAMFVLLVILSISFGVSLSSNTVDTFQPSQSSAPSQIPSVRPSIQPSQSSHPSIRPSISTVPSGIPSMSLKPSSSSPPSTYWSSLDWKLRGKSINGKAEEYYGVSVSLSADGKILAIGGPGNFDGVGGQVVVYGWDEDVLDYIQLWQVVTGVTYGELFGQSVALSADGKMLAIGAIHNDDNGFKSGKVNTYRWDEADLNYKQLGQSIYGQAANDYLGWSLSLSGDGKILAIGAPGNDVDANIFNSGQVRVYGWDEVALNYNQIGQAITGGGAGDSLGQSLALSEDGNTLVVGASQWPDSDGPGYVKTYRWDKAAMNYQQIGQLIPGKASGDEFGFSVSLSADGQTLAVGAPGSFTGDLIPGYVQVYGWDEAALAYTQQGQSITGEAVGDWLGFSIDLSADGKTLATGAPSEDSFNRPGHVNVYGLDGDVSSWKQLGQRITGEFVGGRFGYAVALSADGETLATGSPYNGSYSGQVGVFNIES